MTDRCKDRQTCDLKKRSKNVSGLNQVEYIGIYCRNISICCMLYIFQNEISG